MVFRLRADMRFVFCQPAGPSISISPHHRSPSVHLPRPEGTRPTVAFMRYAVPVVLIHLLGFLCLVPALFSWTGVVVCLVGIHLFGQSITMGYHRLLTHRSFVAKPWFEHLLVVLALCSMEDTPARLTTSLATTASPT